MATFISTRRNNLSNGLIRPIHLSESTRYIRIHSSQITCIRLVNLRKRLLFYVTYERHTIAFFGPLAQPNYQMYSVVITNNNIFTSHTSTQQNLQI